MPTISDRKFPRRKLSSCPGKDQNGRNKNFLLLDDAQLLGANGKSEVTEVEIKWSPDEKVQRCCPAPPCKQNFWWSTPPKPLPGKRSAPKGQKQEVPVEPYQNVMHDKRVVRGSNFGQQALLADMDPFDKAAELRRRHALRKKTQCRNQRNVLGTPPPVRGRHHETIQTEKYLEELVNRPAEYSVDTQTDMFLERPPTPHYVPAKTGIDVATEIGEGELFHFDAEAQPIIDILVDCCIEQSILEVAHEQELSELRKKQEEFLAKREAELAELRRLEAEEIRLQAEKERRFRQDGIAKELDEEMQKGVTAAKLLQGHIAGILPEVLENLEPASDAVKKEQLINTICPWLTNEVAEEVGHIVDSREILTVIIQEIIKQRASAYAGYVEESVSSKEVVDNEEEGLGEDETECCVCTETSLVCPSPPPETQPEEQNPEESSETSDFMCDTAKH